MSVATFDIGTMDKKMVSRNLAVPPSGASAQESKFSRLGMLMGLTLLAAVVGGAVGFYLVLSVKAKLTTVLAAEQDAEKQKINSTLTSYRLAPLVANLGDPPSTWIRLEVAMLYDGKAVQNPEILAAQISADLLGYLKTLAMAQLVGASSFQNLRDDLNERANIRSNGAVQSIVIQSLVLQ